MAQIVIMPTSALCRLSVKGVVGRGNCRLGSAQSEAVEKGEQGVGWLVATGLGRERLDAVDRLLIAEKLICSAALDPDAPGTTYRQD